MGDMCEEAFKDVFVYALAMRGSQEATRIVKPNTSNSSSSGPFAIHTIGAQRGSEIKG